MKLICATLLLALFVNTAVSESWIRRAGKFEGDIALTAEQERRIRFNSTERNAILDVDLKWPNGRVPYQFNNQHSRVEQNVILGAIAQYSDNTCIEFVERNGEEDYIEFTKDDGCYSYLGHNGGRQEVSLDDGCVYEYIIVHELMHAVGFFHEQSRYDRDDYIKINWENICCDAADQFEAETVRTIQLLDEPYDLKSIMHYEEYEWSTDEDNLKTIEALDGTSPLSNHVGFTQIDINKLNKLYECGTEGSEESGSDESGSYESGSASSESYSSESDSFESDSFESDSSESNSHEGHSHELGSSESDSFELDSSESNSHEGHSHESDSSESDSFESDSFESDSSESDSFESDSSESVESGSDSSESVECQDRSPACNFFARIGSCTRRRRVMRVICAASCNYC